MRSNKRGRALAVLLALAGPAAQAHDFWLQPGSFNPDVGRTTSFVLMAGHGEDRQRSPIPARRITRFFALTPLGQTVDLQASLDGAAHDGSARFQNPGAHLLVLQTDNGAQSHMPAYLFNAYLRTEGLTPAWMHRANGHLMGQDGAERYSRVAKALVQAGPAGTGGQDAAVAEVGLPLEIVLDRSPYQLPRTDLLPLHVLYEGRALAGALVKLTNLDNDASPVEMHETGAGGQAVFSMPPPGKWLLNVVWTKPVDKDDGIDFDTVFSSLSFGITR